ncbi:NAD(P)-binding Rossmann-fold superfamily protein [Klebsormidium nitens]|uniref:NAD(P)-binding Rossmann-fold superfamily protein n=1 Tax=Klebsormidium nitens TaxID=105231 RepID=A0A1Y1HMN4_KLENI|nr:NAD(P)-binding Rossmann-fold superfamily protein [Klebsormidium nitens]|eukprot:GAQ79874.1 NAD(P)-binding Rossmann-fold superfamily protein [Klebsormidium nitens]
MAAAASSSTDGQNGGSAEPGWGKRWKIAASTTYLIGLGTVEVCQNVGEHVLDHIRRKPPNTSTTLQGKVCVVTGGNAGVGKGTAEQLAAQGAHVVIACRSAERAKDAVQELKAKAAAASKKGHTWGPVESMSLDLSSLRSVHHFADEYARRGLGVDVLVNNAGVMAPPDRIVTEDGLEAQFQVNYLSHWQLTRELLEQRQGARVRGKAVRPLRIVNLTSVVHQGGHIWFDDLQFEKKYWPFACYGQAKLAIVLSTKEIQRRYNREGVSAVSVHPGLVDTELARNFFTGVLPRPLQSCLRPVLNPVYTAFLRTPEQAVQDVMMAITSPEDAVGGKYIANGKVRAANPVADDPALAARLWEASEEIVQKRL